MFKQFLLTFKVYLYFCRSIRFGLCTLPAGLSVNVCVILFQEACEGVFTCDSGTELPFFAPFVGACFSLPITVTRGALASTLLKLSCLWSWRRHSSRCLQLVRSLHLSATWASWHWLSWRCQGRQSRVLVRLATHTTSFLPIERRPYSDFRTLLLHHWVAACGCVVGKSDSIAKWHELD